MRISDWSSDVCSSDLPALAEGKEYFRLGAFSISNDGTLLAYAIDDNGSERFTIHVKNLESGEHLPDVIPGMLSEILWTGDDSGFLYRLANEQLRRHNARLPRRSAERREGQECGRSFKSR